jgi:hypothetical protein
MDSLLSRGAHDGKLEDLVDVEEELKRVGLIHNAVDLVIQAHLHFNHVVNTHPCKNGRVIVRRSEPAFVLSPHPMRSHLYNLYLLSALGFEVVKGDRGVLTSMR